LHHLSDGRDAGTALEGGHVLVRTARDGASRTDVGTAPGRTWLLLLLLVLVLSELRVLLLLLLVPRRRYRLIVTLTIVASVATSAPSTVLLPRAHRSLPLPLLVRLPPRRVCNAHVRELLERQRRRPTLRVRRRSSAVLLPVANSVDVPLILVLSVARRLSLQTRRRDWRLSSTTSKVSRRRGGTVRVDGEGVTAHRIVEVRRSVERALRLRRSSRRSSPSTKAVRRRRTHRGVEGVTLLLLLLLLSESWPSSVLLKLLLPSPTHPCVCISRRAWSHSSLTSLRDVEREGRGRCGVVG
jgi:hypothetical protein